MGLLRERREAKGLTQGDVALRMGISASAISQAEAAEDSGAITLRTLARHLSALGEALDVRAARHLGDPHFRPDSVAWPGPPTPRGRAQVSAYARDRARKAAIAGMVACSGIDMDPLDVWVLADGVSVGAPARDVLAVREITRSFDDWSRTSVHLDLEREADPRNAAVRETARLLRAGRPLHEAVFRGNAGLLTAGFDWIVLRAGDRQALDSTIAPVQWTGDASRLMTLMSSRYEHRS